MAVVPDVSTIGAALRSMEASSSSPTAVKGAAAIAIADVEKLGLIEELTSDVDAVQRRVLAEILSRNAGAEYLTRHGVVVADDDDGGGIATFRAKVPVATYEDLKPYIERIAGGDRSPILSTRPITGFIASSGTSAGKSKLVPVVEDDSDRGKALHGLRTSVLNLHVPEVEKGKGFYLLFVKEATTTPGGLTVQTTLTRVYKSEHFKKLAADAYTSPAAAILCEDASQSMYAQMLCGLRRRLDVQHVGAVFPPALLRAIRFLQLNWEQLAADIGAGELSSRVADTSVREAVAGVLSPPDSELAEFIRAECSASDWAGIIARMWPNAKSLHTVVTGAMAQYIPTLEYYGGGLPIMSITYASSECMFGINLQPTCDPSQVSYTIMPNQAYFEFLPVDETGGDGDSYDAGRRLVELARVEVGREYEVVVTTYAGLSRYRVGDVLRVTGFHNAAPQFRFVRHGNVLLSVDADKTDEAELQRGVERASALLLRAHGASVLEYTARVCVDHIPAHYVVYWELLPTTTTTTGPATATAAAVVDDTGVLGRCCLEMEEALGAVYRQCRADGSIGALEIRVVRAGTFEELMDQAVSRGASIAQYKVPRCVTLPHVVELLDSRVVSSHSSPGLPDWNPARWTH